MIERLWRYLEGYVAIEVAAGGRDAGEGNGRSLEAFLNRAAGAGVTLWRVRREDGRLRALIGLGSIPALRPVARSARCRVRFGRRYGLPFAWRRLRRRRVLVAGALLCGLVVYYLSGSFWFIHVRGLESLSEDVLRRELARLGLRPGVRKHAVDLRLLAERLPLEVPGIAWVGVTSYGVRVVLDVVEKEPAPQAAVQGPAHVVARRPGLVLQVLALRGTPVVREGDVVRRGQILIRGEYGAAVQPDRRLPGPGGGGDGGRGVAAQGRVLARTWYSEYVEIPLEEIVTTRTGRTLRRTYLRIGPWSLPVYWQRGHLFRYEVERRTLLALPRWRDRPPPVELLRETRHEVQVVRRPVDAGRARRRAEQRVLARVMRQLPPGSRVEAVESRIVQRGAGFIGVRATIQVIEDIAVQRPFRLPNG